MIRRHAALVAAAAVVLCAGLAAATRQADAGWRPAALASFDDVWQTIDDTFYDVHFNGVDWSAVRDELRPKVAAADSPEAVRTIIRDMIGRLGQSHFELLTTAVDSETLPGAALVPIDIRAIGAGLVVTAVVPKSSAARAGIRPGDRLLAVDGTEISGWFAHATSANARAVRLEVWKHATRALHGATASVAHLSIAHPTGAPFSADVERGLESGDVVTFGNLPPMHVRTTAVELKTPGHRRVGVIGFNVWMVAVAEPFADAVDAYRKDAGLIIDLRGNPGGLADMIRGIAGHLLNEPALLGRMHMRQADLEFRANPRRVTNEGRRVEPYAGPVALLVDELTASASECFAGGLQSLGRVRVFGEQTMGQALPAATKALPDGDVLLYAIGDFVTATGQRLEGGGVTPDQVVPLDPAALAAGRDPVMEAAFRWVDTSGK